MDGAEVSTSRGDLKDNELTDCISDHSASQASRRRILKPLSVFRPAFRVSTPYNFLTLPETRLTHILQAVAQSLTNVDLIYIEEAFERLLLDYDRVFSTQGIPACLWRRTGEIYKGNKEFAELVGVGIEALREGRCTIYELMEEESAVNYWEKYGAVSFDPGQKAVLTSCVLKTRAKTSSTESSSSEVFSSSISADGGAGSERNAGQGLGSGRASGEASLNVSGTATPSHGKVDASLNSTPGPVAAAQSSQKETDVRHIPCCFSFTIRRDAWSIPCLIVGNFLPLKQ